MILMFLFLAFNAWAESPYPNFDDYLTRFGKTYSDRGVYLYRKGVYENRIKSWETLPELSYKCGVNLFSDWTNQELENLKALKPQPSSTRSTTDSILRSSKLRLAAPLTINWVQQNMVTPVRQQGTCGACWTFATTGQAESKLIIQGKAGQALDLSEQYLLSCTPQCSCNGGFLSSVFRQALHGLPTEIQYPYHPTMPQDPGICVEQNKINVGMNIAILRNSSPKQLESFLALGPVAIAISSQGWENYGSGIFTCSPGASIDHAALLVGYTSQFWMVKNQWGKFWGENGYIRISKSLNSDCGIRYSAFTLTGPSTFQGGYYGDPVELSSLIAQTLLRFTQILALLFAFQ